MVSAAIEDWVWRSHAIIAAALAADGTIRAPNPALERLAGARAGRRAAGGADRAVPAPGARPRGSPRPTSSGARRVFAFLAAGGRPSIDRRLWLAPRRRRAARDRRAASTDEQERLVEKVLELNDELVATHRELVRQRSAADAAAERVAAPRGDLRRRPRRPDLDAVLHDVAARDRARRRRRVAPRSCCAKATRSSCAPRLGEWHEGARVAPRDVISTLDGAMAACR